MEANQIAGAQTQIRARQKGASGLGSPRADECDPLCGARRWRLAASARRLPAVADRLWLLPPLEPGLDVDLHPRRPAGLAAQERRSGVAPTAAIIDSQSVKTPDPAGESGYDAGKKIKGRKRHVAVDALGLILTMVITSAAVQDRDAAKTLLKTLMGLFGRLQIIWADGGYLGSLVQWVKGLRPFGKLHLEIVRRCDRSEGFKVLPKRWIMERTFGWLIKSRRLCRDYEVRLDHSEAMIRICMIRLMVRRLASI